MIYDKICRDDISRHACAAARAIRVVDGPTIRLTSSIEAAAGKAQPGI